MICFASIVSAFPWLRDSRRRYTQNVEQNSQSAAGNLQKDPATLVLAAFKGWSNAAEASSEALEYLLEVWDVISVNEISQDDYYSYTENRPEIYISPEGRREIYWPATTISEVKCVNLPNTRIFIIVGDEPNLRWQQYCTEVLSIINPKAPGLVITLGGMLAEVLHNRPIHVHGNASDPRIQEITGFELSRYEGPVSMLNVLQDELEGFGFESASLWAAIPHYVAGDPCPKASLALLRGIEDVLDIAIPLDDMVENARAWQTGADDLATADDDIADYVRSLEEGIETAELPEASGEAIAREFERYLRRREN